MIRVIPNVYNNPIPKPITPLRQAGGRARSTEAWSEAIARIGEHVLAAADAYRARRDARLDSVEAYAAYTRGLRERCGFEARGGE